MISDLKLGFKLMKYGHAAKLSFIASIITVVFGLLYTVLAIFGYSNFPGGYFIMMSALFLMQLLATVNVSNLVQSSPAKKRLQTRIPALLSVALMLVGHLLNVISLSVFACIWPDTIGNICTQIILTDFIMGIVMLYYGICYKKFMLGTILFFVVFFSTYGAILEGELQWRLIPGLSFRGNLILTAVIGLAVILVCGVLNYLISLALFKEPMSKWAQGARLRKQM